MSALRSARATRPPSASPPPLSTRLLGRRVVLRAPRPGDVPELRALLRANATHLSPWSPSRPAASWSSLVEVSRAVARERQEWRRGEAFVLLVALRERGQPLIGRVALTQVVRGGFQNASLGYWIARDRQSRGLGTEAVELALRLAFSQLGLHRVQAAVMPRNLASRRLLDKLGFRQEGLAHRYLQIAGRWEDHVLYALTSD
jgi:ribosomal-protein-alanine N-acetyltransferase